jgi:hypothetical protein
VHCFIWTEKPIQTIIRFDRQSILLELPAGGSKALAFADVAGGAHQIQYGVFDGKALLNGRIQCVRV